AWKDIARGIKVILWIMGIFPASRPKGLRAKFLESFQKAQAEAEHDREERKNRRIEQGEPAEVGTGKPWPKVMLVESEEQEELDWEALEFEATKVPGGLGDMNAWLNDAKLHRDQRALSGMRLGHSRLGGVPDLPPGMQWPTY